MHSYILEFCRKYDYPEEAVSFLAQSYDKLVKQEKLDRLFSRYRRLYALSLDPGFHTQALRELSEASRGTQLHEYTVHFLFYVCLSKDLKKRYQARQLPDSMFDGMMLDLKYKLTECRQVYGIWGTFVASWYPQIFEMNIFTLGRLEFQICHSGEEYHVGSIDVYKGDVMLSVHIPSGGPLLPEACEASFLQAKEFFRDLFPDRKTVFICSSWLLFPEHEHLLPPSSNIREFSSRFQLISHDYYTDLEELWRLFEREIHTVEDCADARTSLQEAYYKHLLNGGRTGYGFGIFAL